LRRQETTIALAYLRLIHPVPVLFVMIGTALFGLLAAGGRPEAGRYLLMLAAMLGGQVAIGALNERCDAQHDARHQPWKPIPAGLVSPRSVPPIIAAGLIAAILAGAALGGWPLALLLLGTGSGIVYDVWLKRTPLSWLPYLVSLPLLPIWAWLVMDGFEPRLLWLYPFGGLYVLAVHLAQTLPDIAGDDASDARGLAVVLGERLGRIIIWAVAFGTALAMPIGALIVGTRPAWALLAASVAAALFALFLIRSRRGSVGPRDSRLFEMLAAGATILGAGWVLAVT
jgi:4-hydroxybenzoate polyprenyltransferase